MKKLATLIAAATLAGAPHIASAATLALPVGTLVPSLLSSALPLVNGVLVAAQPLLGSINLPVGTALLPSLLSGSLPLVNNVLVVAQPLLASINLPVGNTLLPELLSGVLPGLSPVLNGL